MQRGQRPFQSRHVEPPAELQVGVDERTGETQTLRRPFECEEHEVERVGYLELGHVRTRSIAGQKEIRCHQTLYHVHDPEVVAAIKLVQQKVWPFEFGEGITEFRRVEILIPYTIRREVLTFFSATLHLLGMDLTQWFQKQIDGILESWIDFQNVLPTYYEELLVERITGKDKYQQEKASE